MKLSVCDDVKVSRRLVWRRFSGCCVRWMMQERVSFVDGERRNGKNASQRIWLPVIGACDGQGVVLVVYFHRPECSLADVQENGVVVF